MKLLELFSGTHSIGKVASKYGIEVVSLDRDLGDKCPYTEYKSQTHIKEDIMTWNYKQYPTDAFDIITASPVCLWWSHLRECWIGRKCRSIHPTEVITKQHILDHIEEYGKPMVDRVIEIIEYFKPSFWWIENPQNGKMKNYIQDKYPQYNTFYDIDYCQYSDFGYRKTTRIWTNIPNFIPKRCDKKKCTNMINGKHKITLGHIGGGLNRLDRYRVPYDLIKSLLLHAYPELSLTNTP